jgi:CubicO group peptidase (beta-lactamase class C family)
MVRGKWPIARTTAAVVGVISLIGLSQPARAQTPARTPIPNNELVRKIEAYIAPFATRELSGTLLVARGDRLLMERSFGFAHHELQVPFTPTTPSNIASITKALTIIVATRLAELGKLALTDTVARWLPEYVHGARMTVAQLLDHSAGVAHRLVPESSQTEPRTAAQMVAFANGQDLLFEPGSQTSYSSGGYAILAAVLEKASGKGYDELLQEFVAAPVGARTVRHIDQRELLNGRATSVIAAGDVVFNAPLRDLSFLVGGGSVYSTPRDVFSIMQGLVRGVYGRNARTALVRDTGLRWNGITNGFRAFADWHAADSLTVMFFSNAHTGAIDLLRRNIPRLAAGDTTDRPVVPVIESAALSEVRRAQLAGEYDTGGGSRATVKFVSASVALFGDRALAALNDSTFFSFSDYAAVVFAQAPDGAVEAIQWGAGTWGTGQQGPRFARIRE